MSSNDEQLQIVVRAVDQATQTMKAVQGLVTQLGGTAEETATKTGKMSGAFSAFGSVLQGMAIGAGIAIFNELTNVIGRIVDAIPQAIEAGYAWASQIHDIQVETGMTAEQTSSLVAIMRELGVPVDNANRLFAMFGKNLDTNEKLFTSLGVATRTANGDYLDTYTIIHNLQQAFSAHGDSLSKTAAAQELFSRTGFTMLEFLNLSDEQMKQLTIDAGNAGMILGGDTTDAAHRFGVEMGKLQNDITGIQTAIFTAVEPMLESFVSSFGAFIQANMDNIVAFVVTVANFIGGVISGLFGIDLGSSGPSNSTNLSSDLGLDGSPTPSQRANTGGGGAMKTPAAAKGGAKGPDPYVTAIKAQTDAIDDQIAALTKLDNVQKDAQKETDLQKAIADAQTQLADLQQSAVNTFGLSSAEQIKAQQKRAADILAAQAKIVTTEVSLADWKKSQDTAAQKAALEDEKKALADQLAAHQANNAGISGGVKAIAPIVASAFTDLSSTLTAGPKDFSKQASDALASGRAAAEGLKATLKTVWDVMLGLGGVMLGIADVIGRFVIGPLQWLNTLLGPVGGLGGVFVSLAWGPLMGVINSFRFLQDNVLPGVQDILGHVGDAFRTLLDNIKKFIDGLPKIPTPTFWTPWNTGGHAEGAVFDHDQFARVGEGSETEYLLPTSKLLNFAAMAIAGTRPAGGNFSGPGGSGPTTLQIVIDKRVLGEVVDEALARRLPATGRGLVSA